MHPAMRRPKVNTSNIQSNFCYLMQNKNKACRTKTTHQLDIVWYVACDSYRLLPPYRYIQWRSRFYHLLLSAKKEKKVAFFNIVIFPIYLKEKQFTELSFIATGNNDLAKNIFLTNFAFKSAKNLNPIRQYIPS